MQYTSLAALQQAYATGELSRETDRLVIDNDTTYVYVDDECVFRGEGPAVLLEEALDLLHIPWEPA